MSESRSTYIPSTEHLLLHPMPTPPHGFVVAFFQEIRTELLLSSQITSAEFRDLVHVAHSVGLPARGSPPIIGKKVPARSKEADWAIGLRVGVHKGQPDIPTLVMECGVSQKESDLGLDARQWLLRSDNRGMRCVVLVKILEGPKMQYLGQSESDMPRDSDTDDPDHDNTQDDLAAYDSDESTISLYEHIKARFVASTALTAAWAGEITAWIEVWRIDSNTGLKMEDRITLLPVQAGAELVLRRGDFGLPTKQGEKNELRVPLEQLGRDLERDARTGLAYARWVRKRSPLDPGNEEVVQG